MKLGGSKVRIKGVSMLPNIQENAYIYIDFHAHQFTLGDIAVFYKNNQLFAHRVISILSKNKLLLKGDNNQFADGYIDMKHILGKVIMIENNKKYTNLEALPHTLLKYFFVVQSRIQLFCADETKSPINNSA
jgi:hypothetical protein